MRGAGETEVAVEAAHALSSFPAMRATSGIKYGKLEIPFMKEKNKEKPRANLFTPTFHRIFFRVILQTHRGSLRVCSATKTD